MKSIIYTNSVEIIINEHKKLLHDLKISKGIYVLF